MTAYKHAYFNPEQLMALIARVSAERGPDFDVSCYFNDRRLQYRSSDGPAPDSPSETTLTWVRQQDNVVEHLFIHFDDVPDTMQITLDIDTHALAPAAAEQLLFGIETVAVEAASDGSRPTLPRAAHRSAPVGLGRALLHRAIGRHGAADSSSVDRSRTPR